jgi:hypothetical protein
MRVPIVTIAISAAAIGLIAGLGSSCANDHSSAHSTPGGTSTSPQPSTATSHPPLSQTFNSPLMGYTVDYPNGWTTTPATDLWVPSAPNYWDDPVGDRLESAVAGFRGTSQLLAKGASAERWVHDYMAVEPTGCGKREQVPVDGQMATIGLNGCAGQGRLGGKVFDLVVVSGNRGYNFTMEGNVDRDLLLAMLATVKLDPSSAKTPE